MEFITHWYAVNYAVIFSAPTAVFGLALAISWLHTYRKGFDHDSLTFHYFACICVFLIQTERFFSMW